MKKKYYTIKSKEVREKDIIKEKHKNGPSSDIKEFIVPSWILDLMVQRGIITVEGEERDKKMDNSCEEVTHYLQRIKDRTNLSMEDMTIFTVVLSTFYPGALYDMLLREIALELSEKYKKHISESPKIYTVNRDSMQIHEVDKASIKGISHYRMFPAFRSIEDTRTALTILNNIYRTLNSKMNPFI